MASLTGGVLLPGAILSATAGRRRRLVNAGVCLFADISVADRGTVD
ncbi:hypothetical protein ACFPN7_25890 [Amycolatopsis halotolerans]